MRGEYYSTLSSGTVIQVHRQIRHSYLEAFG